MLSIFSFHPVLVPVSSPSPVTFQLKPEHRGLPILPLKMLRAFVSEQKSELADFHSPDSEKSCWLEGWNNQTQFGYMKFHDTLQWATELYCRILCALIDSYLSNLRLKWNSACHLSSFVNATACLKHRLCSANQWLYCKCSLSILYVICSWFCLGKKSISLVGFP